MGPLQRRHSPKGRQNEIRAEEKDFKRRKAPSSSRRQDIRKVASFLLIAVAFAAFITTYYISDVSPSTSKSLGQHDNEKSKKSSVVKSNRNDTKDKQCSNILLYLEDTFAANGIGCQLNSYVLATIVSLYTNRRLVILSKNRFKTVGGGSQFGCPSGNPEADEQEFPLGLSRLLQTPDWLDGDCDIPCINQYNYSFWNSFIGNRGMNTTTCTDAEGRRVSILPMDGDGIRGFAMDEFQLKKNEARNDSLYNDLYSRLGATPAERDWLLTKDKITWSKKDLWDQIISILNRRNIIAFQPWITRNANEKVRQIGLPHDYIAIHIRRGDKLRAESRHFVVEFWEKRGYNKTTLPQNYIPFSFYMEQLEKNDGDGQGIKTIYVATDDPLVVKEEIANLTNAHGYKFIMNPDDASSTGHIQTGYDCQERYRKTIAAVTDLMVLSRAKIFVGEYSSNWGRFIRTLRTSFDNKSGIGTGKPRDIRPAFGNWQPPGW